MPEAPRGLDLARLEALVVRMGARGPLRVTEMPGGASTRRYFRVDLDGFVDGSAAAGGTSRAPDTQTAVAMFVPEGGKPEELGSGKAAEHVRWPFLEVRDLLAASGVDVPALYAEDQEHGWLLLEDLGDATLANHLARTSDPGARERLYRQAVLESRARAASPRDASG